MEMTKLFLIPAILAATTLIVACEKAGPAQEIGRTIDQQAKQAAESFEKARDSISETLEQADAKIESSTD